MLTAAWAGRVSNQDMYELYYVSRVDVDPKPNLLTSNPKGIRMGYFIHLFKPPEFIYTRIFNLRYLDYNNAYHGWRGKLGPACH